MAPGQYEDSRSASQAAASIRSDTAASDKRRSRSRSRGIADNFVIKILLSQPNLFTFNKFSYLPNKFVTSIKKIEIEDRDLAVHHQDVRDQETEREIEEEVHTSSKT